MPIMNANVRDSFFLWTQIKISNDIKYYWFFILFGQLNNKKEEEEDYVIPSNFLKRFTLKSFLV